MLDSALLLTRLRIVQVSLLLYNYAAVDYQSCSNIHKSDLQLLAHSYNTSISIHSITFIN